MPDDASAWAMNSAPSVGGGSRVRKLMSNMLGSLNSSGNRSIHDSAMGPARGDVMLLTRPVCPLTMATPACCTLRTSEPSKCCGVLSGYQFDVAYRCTVQ